MANNGREDLFHYTYLTANGYLNKFRAALNMPNLPLGRLAALLKEYKNRTRLMGFIVKNRQGTPCLYYKQTLNKILGMSDDGFTHTKPENNPNIQMLKRIEQEWDEKEYEKERAAEKQYEPIDYSSDEEDMQKMSDALANLEEGKQKTVKNDKGEIVPEKCDKCGGEVCLQIKGEPVYICKKCGKYFGTMPCNLEESFNVKKALKSLQKRRDPAGIEKKKGKKITITESQFDDLKKRINEQYFVEPEKVSIVVNYLDNNFVRGSIPALGEDGYPTNIGVVGLKFKDGNVAKNMTATQLFYLLQDKFNKIYEDPKQRDAFLKKIVVDWYYKRIKNGLLSKNNY